MPGKGLSKCRKCQSDSSWFRLVVALEISFMVLIFLADHVCGPKVCMHCHIRCITTGRWLAPKRFSHATHVIRCRAATQAEVSYAQIARGAREFLDLIAVACEWIERHWKWPVLWNAIASRIAKRLESWLGVFGSIRYRKSGDGTGHCFAYRLQQW